MKNTQSPSNLNNLKTVTQSSFLVDSDELHNSNNTSKLDTSYLSDEELIGNTISISSSEMQEKLAEGSLTEVESVSDLVFSSAASAFAVEPIKTTEGSSPDLALIKMSEGSNPDRAFGQTLNWARKQTQIID